MNEALLTKNQIDKLFELCEFHKVHYYDVQIELVDHIASAIEKLWETNPETSFEEAVSIIAEPFGVDPFFHISDHSLLPSISGKKVRGESGFNIIKEAKENELRRKYDRLQLRYIQEFFRFPKIILTITITLVLYFVFRISANNLLVCGILQCVFLISIIVYWKAYPEKFNLKIKSEKSFLLYEYFKTVRFSILSIAGITPSWIIFFDKVLRFKSVAPILNYLNFQLIAAFLITLFGITIIAVGVYTPRRIKEDFTREYPQFVKS